MLRSSPMMMASAAAAFAASAAPRAAMPAAAVAVRAAARLPIQQGQSFFAFIHAAAAAPVCTDDEGVEGR
jgi:hypothetical protein